MTVDIVLGAQLFSLLRFKENGTKSYLFLLFGLIVFQMVVQPLFRRYLNVTDNMNIK